MRLGRCPAIMRWGGIGQCAWLEHMRLGWGSRGGSGLVVCCWWTKRLSAAGIAM